MALSAGEDFDYILGVTKPGRIAFGSGLQREILPRRGTSKFTNTFNPEVIPRIAPNSYYAKLPECKKEHVLGFGGLARTEERFKRVRDYKPFAEEETPPHVTAPKVKPNYCPFNSTTPRVTFTSNSVPGPGTYNTQAPRDRRIKFHHSFGGRKKMVPAVDIKCVLYNHDKCYICQTHPEGDYWHLNDKDFLCRDCMNAERNSPTHFKPWQMDKFRLVRDCSFMHIHDFTYAAYIKVDPREAIKMLTKEAYFTEYFS